MIDDPDRLVVGQTMAVSRTTLRKLAEHSS